MDSGSADLWVGGENCLSELGGCVSFIHYTYLTSLNLSYIGRARFPRARI
jgi:hypothetical protein